MPLAEAAYHRLRNMILSGELPPESSLTENSIVDRIEIGKTPVREAMRRLVLEGLLEVTPRLGYTVKAVTRDDIDNLFQMRAILEVAAAELALDRLDDASIDRLLELSVVGYDPADMDSLTTFVTVNAEFHDIIAPGQRKSSVGGAHHTAHDGESPLHPHGRPERGARPTREAAARGHRERLPTAGPIRPCRARPQPRRRRSRRRAGRHDGRRIGWLRHAVLRAGARRSPRTTQRSL
ncbi:MAG: GntR family transcriptional regulator [Gemmatimonadaceae bacterium]|nr:GntR family transcriptional regulator [Gemmatimonadaceae bacterium]